MLKTLDAMDCPDRKRVKLAFQDIVQYDFMTIRRGGRPVVEYIVEFQKFVKMFSEMAPTVKARFQHFVKGLDPVICRQVNLINAMT